MTASLVVHEVLGHGLAAILCGSRGIVFRIDPGFSGAGGGTDPLSETGAWFVHFAGIGANGLAGLLVLGLLRLRPPRLTPVGLPLFWGAATELGHALGYTLQGLLFLQGDAADLPELIGPPGRLVAVTVVLALLVLLAAWALSGVAGFVRDHFQSQTLPSIRRAFVWSFTLPMAIIVVVAPGLPRRETWTIVAFDACILGILAGVTLWILRRMPTDTEPKGRPIRWRAALAWTMGALMTFAATSLWLSRGVSISLGHR